jgi:5'-nucleotidase / UDP-sugar diphosphatase
MKIFTSLLILLTLIFSGSLQQLQATEEPAATEIVILHTNDMHAKIDNLGKLAYLADSLRKTNAYVFLVAAGDNFTGNPIVDMAKDKGSPMIDLMNHCGFNLSAIGNHEFDLGQKTLNARMKQATFPFISCNINASGAVLKQPKPFSILKAGKIEIPVLGIIQLGQNGLPSSHSSKLKGLKFTPGIEKAREYSWLKKKYGMLVGLTHLGVEGDEPLAKAMPEFDLIIGGHSHTAMTRPMMIDNVMIVQTGSGLKNVGKITLTVQNGSITNRTYELISLDSIKQSDLTVQDLIDKYNNNDTLNRVVGHAEAPVEGMDELGSMMTDAITSRLKVDFAFQNIGGIRISSLPAGKISLKDVYRLDPFGNMVVSHKMNAAEIKSLICTSYDREKQLELEVSGMTYSVQPDQDGTCKDVEMLDISGKPLDEDKEYTVGVNSYISASYKFDHRDPGTSTYTTSAQALIDYLGAVKKVNYSGVKRISVETSE